MYFSCLASLTQICEISILLHEAKPSNQFLLKEKHVNHDLVLKFNKKKATFVEQVLTTQTILVYIQTSYKNQSKNLPQKGLISQNYTSSQNVIEPNNKKNCSLLGP